MKLVSKVLSIILVVLSGTANAGLINSITTSLTEQGGITTTTDRYGNANSAYLFDGEDDYLSITPDLTINDFSIALDFYIDETANRWERLFDFGNGGRGGDLFLTVKGGRTRGNYELTIHAKNNHAKVVNPGVKAQVNSWHHAAFTFNKGGDGMNFYLDGELKGTNAYNAESVNDWGGSQNWYFGKSNWNDSIFKGKMGGITVTNAVLTSEQVRGLASGNSLALVTTEVPEPSTLAIFALVIMGLATRRFKRNS